MSADLAVRPDVLPGVRIADVIVGERARKDYGDLTGLMESIRTVGLLQPIGLAPGNRLLFGGRRLEACRALGWESIPAVRPETQTDALSLLKAERDENTCRKDMTLTELVAQGRQIEELERPAARERQIAGLRTGDRPAVAESRSDRPIGTGADERSANETRRRVGEALGISGAKFERAKKVIEAAEDETAPEEVRAVAQAAVKEMDETGKVWTPFNKVRDAQKAASRTAYGSSAVKRPPTKSSRPEVLRKTHRIDSHRVIAATVDAAAANALTKDLLAEIDVSELDTHDLGEWISSLSESLKALRSLKSTLEKELSQRG